MTPGVAAMACAQNRQAVVTIASNLGTSNPGR
jgi:hypothetical protein